MKQYFVLIFLWCSVALSKGGWARVWADDFNRNGLLNPNKWDFDEGGDGWGLFYVFVCFFLADNFEFR